MPRFLYRAKDAALQVVEGMIEADSETAAISHLGSQGVFPISIAELGAAPTPRATFRRRVPTRTLPHTIRQLADLLGGGLPLLGALTLLAQQTEQPALRRIIDALATSVRDGRSLSEAMSAHPAIFTPLYLNMVKAGEAVGGLEQALVRLADVGEHEAELRSRLIQASVYPLFVLGLAAAMTIFLMAYVIPTLSLVFIESGQVLPLPTRLLLGVSALCTRWWWLALGGLVVGGWALRGWYASRQGRAAADRLLIALPGIGALVRKIETARFARTLGLMAGQGVPVLQSLDVVARHLSNAVLRDALGRIREAVRQGSSIAGALNASGAFPIFVSNMVAVGEEAGRIDAALMKVAAAYEREIDRAIRTLTAVLEPVLLVVVGGIVMFIVLAMLLPVFQIGLVVQ